VHLRVHKGVAGKFLEPVGFHIRCTQ